MKSIQTVLLTCITVALFGVSQANYVEFGQGECLAEGEYYPGVIFQPLDLAECKEKCGCTEGVQGVKHRGLIFGNDSQLCFCCVDYLDPANATDAAVINELTTKCGGLYFGSTEGSGEITGTDGNSAFTCYRKLPVVGGPGGGNGGGDNSGGSYSMSYSSKGGKSGGGSSKGSKGGSSMSYGSYSGKASKTSSKGDNGGSSMSYAYGGKGGKRA